MNVYFTREHEWIRIGEEGVGVVGISEHAVNELGDVTFVELPKVGAVVEQFGLLGSIESVKAASDIFAPVSGAVIKVNQMLEDTPELINEGAESKGWIAWIRLADPTELINLMTREQYDAYVKDL